MKQMSMYELGYEAGYDLPASSLQQNVQAIAVDFSESAPQQDKQTTSKAANNPNVTEIIIAKDKADSVQLVLPMLTHLNQDKRWLAWIDPPIELLKKWRSQANLSGESPLGDDIMLLRSSEQTGAIQLAERALEAGTCHAVILWTEALDNQAFSDLEAASARGNSHGIVLRQR